MVQSVLLCCAYNTINNLFDYPKTHNIYMPVMLLKVKYALRFRFKGLASSNISKALGQFIPHHNSLEFNHSVTKRGYYWY
jgi:hypothetical protein